MREWRYISLHSGQLRYRCIVSDLNLPTGELRLFKYHALGNSYLVLDPRDWQDERELIETVNGAAQPTSHLVRTLCDECWGIGSNGLLFGPMTPSQSARFQLRIINSDGTPAGFSGNGVRIFAQYLRDAGYVRTGERFNVEIIEATASGSANHNIAPVHLVDGDERRIDVTIPQVPRFGVAAIAANTQLVRANDAVASRAGLSFTVAPLAAIGSRLTGNNDAWSSSTLLDIGNPHCVTFLGPKDALPDLAALHAADDALRDIAFRPDNARRDQVVFANGSNLQWVRVQDRTHLELMIYERGEGPTMASGSSASAAATAAFARRLVDATVDVVMPGGTLAIYIDGTPERISSVTLSGFATRILDGRVDRRALAGR